MGREIKPPALTSFISPQTSLVAVVTFKGIVDRLLQRHQVEDQARRAIAEAMLRYAGPSLPIGTDLLERVTQVFVIADAEGDKSFGFLVVKGRFKDIYNFGKVTLHDDRARAAFLDDATLILTHEDHVLDIVARRVLRPCAPGAELAQHLEFLTGHALLNIAAVRTKVLEDRKFFDDELPRAALLRLHADLAASLEFEVRTNKVDDWKRLVEQGLGHPKEVVIGDEQQWKAVVTACENAERKYGTDRVSVVVNFPASSVKALANRFRDSDLSP